MNNRRQKPFNVSRWIVMIVFVLALESCLLGSIASIVLAARGQLAIPARILPQFNKPVISAKPRNTPVPTATPEISRSNKRTQTAVAQNPTAVPSENADTPTSWENAPGGKIAYVCYDGKFDQICLMNSDGTHQRQLTDIQATNFYPSLSPDGNQILFSSNRSGNFEIYSMDIQGENVTKLTDKIGNLYAPALAPNGNRIVFTRESGKQQDIWLMRSDGGNPHPLTDTGGNIDPTWSPNGEQIAFTSGRNGTKQLFTMNANGNNQRAINLPSVTNMGGRNSWSPDGNWIAFYAGPTGDHNIYIVSPDGRNLTQLTTGGDNLGPCFSPDSGWLTFTSYRDGNNEVYVMKVDGTNQIRLTERNLSDWQPRWGP